MERDTNTLIKHREIRFCRLHPDAEQAHSASLILSDVEGIHRLHPHEPHILHVSYDITLISLSAIEGGLLDLGFHLDNTLLVKLMRALHYYTEEAEKANIGCPDGGCADKQVFINRYQRLRHGCRDRRPEHWRNYL